MEDKNKKTGIAGLFEEFKKFISKGNVIDMAVGVIVGGAFTAIVTSLVEDIIMPIVGTILVGINFNDFGIRIPWGNHPFINIGNFAETIITFLLTAACVFAIVKLIGVFYKKSEPAAPKPSKEEELLTEIRDLLKEQNGKPVEEVKKELVVAAEKSE